MMGGGPTLTATCSLAVRLEGPDASKARPSTSTLMVNTGTCTGPVWDSSRYCSPGFSWFSRIRAFMVWGGSALSSGAAGGGKVGVEISWYGGPERGSVEVCCSERLWECGGEDVLPTQPSAPPQTTTNSRNV